MNRLDNNGTIFDVLSIVTTLFGAVIVLILAVYVHGAFKTGIEESGFLTPELNESITTMETNYGLVDQLFIPVLAIVLMVGLIISSWQIPSHPSLVIINVIGIVFIILLTLALHVAYDELSSTDLTNAIGTLNYSPLVIESLMWIGIAATVISTLVGYSKSRSDLI